MSHIPGLSDFTTKCHSPAFHPRWMVFRLLTDFVCLLTYDFCLFLWKIARCSVILLLPLFAEKDFGQILSLYLEKGES
jgi:hypothetical protein